MTDDPLYISKEEGEHGAAVGSPQKGLTNNFRWCSGIRGIRARGSGGGNGRAVGCVAVVVQRIVLLNKTSF